QKGLYESNQEMVDEAKSILSNACDDPALVRGKVDLLYDDEEKVSKIRTALETQLENYYDNEFVFANFAAVVEEEARQATHMNVMGSVVDPIDKSYYATPNGLLLFTSIESGRPSGLNPISANELAYRVFFGRQMLSDDPSEVIASAGSKICSDKVFMLNEDAHLEDTTFTDSQIFERDWLNEDYFPKNVAGREQAFYRFDFEANMLAHINALFAEDVTADVIEKQQDLVILSALYDLQRAAYQGNSNAALSAVKVMSEVCDNESVRIREVARLQKDRKRILIPKETIEEAHEQFVGVGFEPIAFSNRMDVEEVNQRMFLAIEGNEMQRRMADLFGVNKGVSATINEDRQIEVRKTRYYPTPGGSSIYPDITSAARAIQSSPLGIDPTDYLVFFGRGMEAASDEEAVQAEKSLICSDKVYLVEEDGVFEDVSLERLMLFKRSWLDNQYYPELVGEREGRFLQVDFMTYALKHLELGKYEDMDAEAKERLIDLAIMNSLYDLQEAIYKKDRRSVVEVSKVLDQVCSDEEVQREQYDVLKAERIKRIGAIQTARTVLDRFENSEYEAFDFASIDELKALGVLGDPLAKRWADIYGNSIIATHFVDVNPMTETVYSQGLGQAAEGERIIEFPMLVLSGSAGEESVCNFGYTFMVIPGITRQTPDGRPQSLYVLGIKPTDELDYEAETFEEMVGAEVGSGVAFADLQEYADQFTGRIFEARDKGLLSFEDEAVNNQLMSSMS
ncbi:MAG: hypothetical protein AAF202_05770, partial [Pseudomonadota bacterium]